MARENDGTPTQSSIATAARRFALETENLPKY
jgi:hypothetical protein